MKYIKHLFFIALLTWASQSYSKSALTGCQLLNKLKNAIKNKGTQVGIVVDLGMADAKTVVSELVTIPERLTDPRACHALHYSHFPVRVVVYSNSFNKEGEEPVPLSVFGDECHVLERQLMLNSVLGWKEKSEPFYFLWHRNSQDQDWAVSNRGIVDLQVHDGDLIGLMGKENDPPRITGDCPEAKKDGNGE